MWSPRHDDQDQENEYTAMIQRYKKSKSDQEKLKVTKIALGQMDTVKQLKDDYVYPNLHSLLADKVMLNAGTRDACHGDSQHNSSSS